MVRCHLCNRNRREIRKLVSGAKGVHRSSSDRRAAKFGLGRSNLLPFRRGTRSKSGEQKPSSKGVEKWEKKQQALALLLPILRRFMSGSVEFPFWEYDVVRL